MLQKISEGNVVANPSSGKTYVAPRIAVLPDGKIAVSFTAETRINSEDFITMISYSKDGDNWSEAKVVWPHLLDKKSNYAGIRNTLDGRFCMGGVMWPDFDGNKDYWSDEIGGMLENKLIFSMSEDGYDFPGPIEIDLPYYGSAENPGGAFVDEDGTIYLVYAPYRAIESKEDTKTNCLVLMKSTDGGKTFTHTVFGDVPAPAQFGESWIVRLDKDKHMVGTWQTSTTENADKYFMSYDGAKTFEGPFDMPFNGQSTALDAIGDGRVLVIYNLRNVDPAGVYLALAKPDKNGFNMIENQCIWSSSQKTFSGTSGEFDAWTDFAFGEPHVKMLPDGTILACLWYEQNGVKGIRYVRLALED